MLQYGYTCLILQLCGRSGLTGTIGTSVPPWHKASCEPRTQHYANGTPAINPKFPDMPALVKYGHSKGLTMGWYENGSGLVRGYVRRTWSSKVPVGPAYRI